ncbi:MAG: hypothetical protein RIQ93_3330 [Verrucomicrobiota bacterium]
MGFLHPHYRPISGGAQVNQAPRKRGSYFFLFAAAFAFVACCEVISACFFWLDTLDFDCFCVAFFCTDFGDLSPMLGYLSLS